MEFTDTRFKKNIQKEWAGTILKNKNIISMHNGKYQSHIQAAQQELYPHKKACLLTRNIGEFSGEKLNRMDH